MKEIALSEITSRGQLSRLVAEFRDEILSGNINPLQAAATLKALEDFTKELRGNCLIRDCIREELEKYPEKSVKYNGVTFTKKATGTRYDFSGCGDTELLRLQTRAKIASDALKSREDFLKAVPEGGIDSFSQETGETFKLFPPVKISEDGYSIMFDK
jgi:hypothetical protein